ncbi:MAG: hypothetical protein IPO93_10025 [Actinobacteria bacterium]|jgi:hypothetical protein|nr:hypothetical protein [Actinomycetota bacterium]
MTGTESHLEAPDQPMLRIPKSAHPTPTDAVRSSRRIPVLAFAGILLALIAVLVVGTQALGWFGTTGQMTAGSGERVVPAAGADTAEIKGWMSLQQVVDAYPVSQAALYARFAIPADTPLETTLSELKESGASSLDVPTLRSWIDDGAPASS